MKEKKKKEKNTLLISARKAPLKKDNDNFIEVAPGIQAFPTDRCPEVKLWVARLYASARAPRRQADRMASWLVGWQAG